MQCICTISRLTEICQVLLFCELLRRDIVQSGKLLPLFRMNILPPSYSCKCGRWCSIFIELKGKVHPRTDQEGP